MMQHSMYEERYCQSGNKKSYIKNHPSHNSLCSIGSEDLKNSINVLDEVIDNFDGTPNKIFSKTPPKVGLRNSSIVINDQENDVYDIVYSSRRSSYISNQQELNPMLTSQYEGRQRLIQRRHTMLGSNGKSPMNNSNNNVYEFDSDSNEESFDNSIFRQDCKTLMRNKSMKPLVPKRSPSTKLTLTSTPADSANSTSKCASDKFTSKKSAPSLPVRKDSTLSKGPKVVTTSRREEPPLPLHHPLQTSVYANNSSNQSSLVNMTPFKHLSESFTMDNTAVSTASYLDGDKDNHDPTSIYESLEEDSFQKEACTLERPANQQKVHTPLIRQEPKLVLNDFVKEIKDKSLGLRPVKSITMKTQESDCPQKPQTEFARDVNENIIIKKTTNDKPVLVNDDPKRSPFAGLALTEDQIFLLKSKRIENLTQIPETHIVPDNCPNWKRDHLNKKNREAVMRFINKIDVSPVPEWKQAILEKRKREEQTNHEVTPNKSQKENTATENMNSSPTTKFTPMRKTSIKVIPTRCNEPDQELAAKLKERLLKSSGESAIKT